MWCNQIFSLIHENTIKNIIVCDNYEMANQIARDQFGEDAFANDTTLYPVSIGDLYNNGNYYHLVNEDPENPQYMIIERNLTEAEEINELKNQNIDLLMTLVDSIYDVSLLQLGV